MRGPGTVSGYRLVALDDQHAVAAWLRHESWFGVEDGVGLARFRMAVPAAGTRIASTATRNPEVEEREKCARNARTVNTNRKEADMLRKALKLAVIPLLVLGCGNGAGESPSDGGSDHDGPDSSTSLGPAAPNELDDGVDNCQGTWEWQPGPAMNVPRRGARAVGLDGSLFVIGGVTPDGPTKSVERLDDGSHAWREVAPMPSPNAYFAAGAADGSVYVVGGYKPGFQEVIAAAFRYDVTNDTWEQLPDMPTARANATAVFWNGRLVVSGGRTRVSPAIEITGVIEAYDPATRAWTSIAPGMPTPREGCSGIVEDGRLLLAGGSTADMASMYGMKLVEYFSSEDLSWHSGTPLGVARVSAASGNPRGCAVVAGGWMWYGPGAQFTSAEALGDKGWFSLPDLPTSRWDPAAAVMKGAFYAIGGAQYRGARDYPISSSVDILRRE